MGQRRTRLRELLFDFQLQPVPTADLATNALQWSKDNYGGDENYMYNHDCECDVMIIIRKCLYPHDLNLSS